MAKRAFWLMTAALLTIGFLAAGGTLRGRLLAAGPQPHVSVSEVLVSRGSNEIVLDIRQPVISGLNDAALERALNERIRAQVDAAAAAAQAEAAALWREAETEGFTPWAYVFFADYEAYCTRGILSLRVTTALDNGGVGFPHTVYYNIDIERSRWLQLNDLFASNGYREALGAYIKEQISSDPRFFADEFAGITPRTPFFVRGGRLHIAFAKYEIASGMTGEPVFAIPPRLLHGQLKPEYSGLFN
jgi:hypothetical protein